jgi:hypothetical protein
MYSKTLSIAKSLIAHLEKKKGTRIARPFFIHYPLSAMALILVENSNRFTNDEILTFKDQLVRTSRIRT